MCVKLMCVLADLIPTTTTGKRLQISNIRLHNRGRVGLVFFGQTGSGTSFMSTYNGSKTTLSNYKNSLLSACMYMHLV